MEFNMGYSCFHAQVKKYHTKPNVSIKTLVMSGIFFFSSLRWIVLLKLLFPCIKEYRLLLAFLFPVSCRKSSPMYSLFSQRFLSNDLLLKAHGGTSLYFKHTCNHIVNSLKKVLSRKPRCCKNDDTVYQATDSSLA